MKLKINADVHYTQEKKITYHIARSINQVMHAPTYVKNTLKLRRDFLNN